MATKTTSTKKTATKAKTAKAGKTQKKAEKPTPVVRICEWCGAEATWYNYRTIPNHNGAIPVTNGYFECPDCGNLETDILVRQTQEKFGKLPDKVIAAQNAKPKAAETPTKQKNAADAQEGTQPEMTETSAAAEMVTAGEPETTTQETSTDEASGEDNLPSLHCDWCGAPAVARRFRTLYEDTEFEQTGSYNECAECNSLDTKDLMARLEKKNREEAAKHTCFWCGRPAAYRISRKIYAGADSGYYDGCCGYECDECCTKEDADIAAKYPDKITDEGRRILRREQMYTSKPKGTDFFVRF